MTCHKPTIYFLDQDKENIRMAKKVLACLSPETIFPKKFEEFNEILEKEELSLIIIDFEIYLELTKSGMDFSKKNILFLSSKKLSEISSKLNTIPQFSHFIAKTEEGKLTGPDLFCTANKILKGDIFGLEKYLIFGGQIEKFQIKNSGVRQELVQKMGVLAKRMGLRKPIFNAVRVLTDEFLMNALYDAPVDKSGQPKYIKLERHEEFDLLENEIPTIKWGSDGRTFGISISDPFGRITKQQVLGYLTRCLENRDSMVRDDEGTLGGGVGLYMCFNMVQKFIINVDPGKKTEFIGLFDLSQSVEEWMRGNKSFHFFKNDPDSKLFK